MARHALAQSEEIECPIVVAHHIQAFLIGRHRNTVGISGIGNNPLSRSVRKTLGNPTACAKSHRDYADHDEC
jgi:hypothetical protein